MKEKIANIWEKTGIYGVIAVIQYLMAVFFNFKYTVHAVDTDAAKLFRHTVEMSKNHSLYIKDWIYSTNTEWDTAALLAAPFYTITKNINIAFAMSNTVILLAFILVVILTFNRFNMSLKTAFKGCNLFLIPYSFGMLAYFNMLFFNGAEYIFRVMIPLLLVCVLMTPANKRKSIFNIALYVVTMALLLLSAISNGISILIACVVPMIIMVVFAVLVESDFGIYDIYQYIVCGVSVVISLIGHLVCDKMEMAGKIVNNMKLLRWYDFRYYRDAFVEGFFRILGAMPGDVDGEEISVMSAMGIAFLLKFIIAVIMIVVLCVGVKKTMFVGKDKYEEEYKDERGLYKDVDRRTKDIRLYLCGMAFINIVVLFVCETRYKSTNPTLECRYLLNAVVPMLLCIPVQIELWQEAWGKYLKNVVWVLFSVGVLFTTVMCYVNAHERLDAYAYCDELIKYIDETDYHTVIFLADRDTSECCRSKDITRTYESYEPAGFMNIVDFYEANMHASNYDGHHLLFAITGTNIVESMGDYKAGYYTYVDSFMWFDIYSAEEFVLID